MEDIGAKLETAESSRCKSICFDFAGLTNLTSSARPWPVVIGNSDMAYRGVLNLLRPVSLSEERDGERSIMLKQTDGLTD